MTNHAETHGGPAWESLLDKLFDGALTEPESRQLEQRMQASSELRRCVLDVLHVNACLEWEFNRPGDVETLLAATDRPPAAVESVVRQPQWWNWQRLRPIVHHSMTLSLILAALTVTIIVLSLALVEVPAWQDRGETPAAEAFVGNVLGSQDAVWRLEEGAAPPTRLVAGTRLDLESGLIEVELFAGTKAVLEGPLRATVRGDNALALDFGTATFRVPREAIGFRVDTPSVGVVDLGTEFGVHVERDGATDICVFNGEVEAVSTADAGGERLRLTRGRAVRFETGSAVWSSSRLPSERFARRIQSTSVLSSLLCEEPLIRLLDSDRDDRGDDLGQAGGLVAIGEWNNDANPSANEGRVGMVFRLSEAERHNIEQGHRVTATVEVSEFNGVKLNVSAYGLACEPDHTPQAADYERAGELLAEDIFANLPRSGGTATFDLTDFAQRLIQQGDSQFAVRLQVDAPQLPNDDQQRDNVLIRSTGPRRPALLIQTPRREFRATSESENDGFRDDHET